MSAKTLAGDTCYEPGCYKDRRKAGNGRSRWCSAHHAAKYRQERYAEPRPEAHGNPTTYGAVHIALKRTRGKASNYKCLCGEQARHWAYQHSSVDEQTNERGQYFSTDLTAYRPMCALHHRRMDAARRRVEKALAQ